MLNKALDNAIKKGLPGPLYYLWGTENCFLEDALHRFFETVIASHPEDFNYDVYDPSSRPQEIIDSASTLPFMAPRRLVVVKDFHDFTAQAVKVLTGYLKSPSESTCMVIVSRKAPKAALKFNWQVYPLKLQERDVPGWLKHAAEARGVRLTNDAVEQLLEHVGFDIGMLLMEVEKLVLSGKKSITGRDIVSSTSMMRQFTNFELLDAVIAGEKTRALKILKIMLGGNPYDAPVILGTLNWHYRQFYSLWQNRGKRPAKMRERTFRALVKYVPSFNEDNFLNIFKSLHMADLGIKTSGRPAIVMEMLLIKLLQKGAWN